MQEHIWTIENWEKYYDGKDVRTGLRLRCEKDVEPDVKHVCKEFCQWLRKEYYFPIRVVIYLKSSEKVRANDGEYCYGYFHEPYDRMKEPWIVCATGDYQKRLVSWGRESILAANLRTIAHELTHYFQWINDIQLTDRGSERQATMYAHYIVEDYAEVKPHL